MLSSFTRQELEWIIYVLLCFIAIIVGILFYYRYLNVTLWKEKEDLFAELHLAKTNIRPDLVKALKRKIEEPLQKRIRFLEGSLNTVISDEIQRLKDIIRRWELYFETLILEMGQESEEYFYNHVLINNSAILGIVEDWHIKYHVTWKFDLLNKVPEMLDKETHCRFLAKRTALVDQLNALYRLNNQEIRDRQKLFTQAPIFDVDE